MKDRKACHGPNINLIMYKTSALNRIALKCVPGEVEGKDVGQNALAVRKVAGETLLIKRKYCTL
jgi:hypothetical protein